MDIDRMNIDGKHILVLGLGRSGRAVADFASRRGASVVVNDAGAGDEIDRHAAALSARGIRVETGHHPAPLFAAADIIVISPGVPHTLPVLETARKQGTPVMGEVEFASRWITEPMVAISGTNGKTTTTTLVGDMLARSGQSVFVGGNIGDPLIGHVASGRRVDTLVVEISSFQLDTIDEFHPRVAVMLNISEDHLDRYADLAAYVASKSRLFMNQRTGDTAVLNYLDPRIRQLTDDIAADRYAVCRGDGSPEGVHTAALIDQRTISVTRGSDPLGSLSMPAGVLPGGHNVENAAAAALAALAAGASMTGIQAALDAFVDLPHRLQPVATLEGVTWINDSKATNVDAVARALASVPRPVILIMGGRDKGGRFEQLIDALRDRVKQLVTTGEAGDHIASVFDGVVPVSRTPTMADAVDAARRMAVNGDTVLLSPGCTSFDEFTDYAHRGDTFKRLVKGSHAA